MEMSSRAPVAEELPPDNAARIAIYDALSTAAEGEGRASLSADELFGRVISRLKILVPRELHVMGDQAYFEEKISACIEAGILKLAGPVPRVIALGDARPRVAYPDGTIHDYEAGLEAAKERLQADDVKLRQGRFDVHQFVHSVADDQGSEAFKALVESMRERGYLEQFPILESADGRVVDGRARLAAAKKADVTAKRLRIEARRDTPLHHAVLWLDANCTRISQTDRQAVNDAIEQRTRPWTSIERDLERTREWRLADPRKYIARLHVDRVKYHPDDQEPKIQITTDGSRVMLRPLQEATGVKVHNFTWLEPYVAMERARTNFSPSGNPAIFVGVADAIRGIETMQRERRENKRKVDPGWDEIRRWLEEWSFGRSSGDYDPASLDSAPSDDAEPASELPV
jgi:hypothetical protein